MAVAKIDFSDTERIKEYLRLFLRPLYFALGWVKMVVTVGGKSYFDKTVQRRSYNYKGNFFR